MSLRRNQRRRKGSPSRSRRRDERMVEALGRCRWGRGGRGLERVRDGRADRSTRLGLDGRRARGGRAYGRGRSVDAHGHGRRGLFDRVADELQRNVRRYAGQHDPLRSLQQLVPCWLELRKRRLCRRRDVHRAAHDVRDIVRRSHDGREQLRHVRHSLRRGPELRRGALLDDDDGRASHGTLVQRRGRLRDELARPRRVQHGAERLAGRILSVPLRARRRLRNWRPLRAHRARRCHGNDPQHRVLLHGLHHARRAHWMSSGLCVSLCARRRRVLARVRRGRGRVQPERVSGDHGALLALHHERGLQRQRDVQHGHGRVPLHRGHQLREQPPVHREHWALRLYEQPGLPCRVDVHSVDGAVRAVVRIGPQSS
jgi:hypothetical protein